MSSNSRINRRRCANATLVGATYVLTESLQNRWKLWYRFSRTSTRLIQSRRQVLFLNVFPNSRSSIGVSATLGVGSRTASSIFRKRFARL